MPLKVAFSSKMEDYAKGLTYFVYSECGLRLKDKFVHIFHKSFHRSSLGRLLEKIGILDWKFVSIFNPIESILESLKDLRPDVIITYPSMLLLLSKKIREENIDGINPRFIITSGETITDYNRNKISQAFNSDIYCLYGTEECGRLAFECKECSGYHIISDSSIIEFVKEGRNVEEGEQGDIVVTSLFNYTMPLIRYNIGDIGTFTKEKCTCGRGLPLIKSIEGRTDDFLILPSGRKISPRLINVIEDIPGVSMYKTIQENKNRIVVNLVKGEGFCEKTTRDIKNHISEGCFGEDIEIKVKLVNELPLEQRGKRRAVVSNVNE